MSRSTARSHSDPQMCRQCRGLCCQGHPGVWVDPLRFLRIFKLPDPASPETLRDMLPLEITLREIDGIAIPAPRNGRAGCIFLHEEGCRLPESQRPGQCLALVPSLDTLIDGEIHCQLQPLGSTLTALQNWQRFWNRS